MKLRHWLRIGILILETEVEVTTDFFQDTTGEGLELNFAKSAFGEAAICT